MEYDSVRMLWAPVLSCVKTEKSASSISFALLTGTEIASQSPAGEIVVALRPFSMIQALTASTVSFVGAVNAPTYHAQRGGSGLMTS